MEITQVINNVLYLENVGAAKAIEYKLELEKAGLVLNKDFQWKWHSPASKYTSIVEFTFTNPSHATFYKLKWE